MTRTRLLAIIPVLLAAATLASCGQTPDKSGRLLSMAAEEAAAIPNLLDRFTRQLNIADTQLRTARKADAAGTLGLARETLAKSTKDDLDDFHRIAGWTAIAQLARQADARDLAMKSADNALAALNDVQPAAQRAQYVLSLAGELGELRGRESAIELLNSGTGWAVELPDPRLRREVLVMFTRALLDHDSFENVRTALQRDPDAAWRTDTFLALSDAYASQGRPSPDVQYAARAAPTALAQPESAVAGLPAANDESAGGAGGTASTPAASPAAFNRDVRFENVYRRGR